MSGGWIFAVKRPFYPSVDWFASKQEADDALAEWIDENGDGSTYEASVYVAKVENWCTCKTDY